MQNTEQIKKERVLRPKFEILFTLKKLGGKANYSILEKETGLYSNTLNLNLKDLLTQRLIIKEGKNYVLTDIGEEVIQQSKKEVEKVMP